MRIKEILILYVMSKDKDQGKEKTTKKAPTKTLKEKRAEKEAKRKERG